MRPALPVAVLAAALLGATGCRCQSDDVATTPAVPSARLDPALEGRVLARVGDHAITLGEFALAIERLDPFERLRYQSPERRKQLLEELVDLELLADEARRRGLDRDPAVQAELARVLREELLASLREQVPAPESFPEADVRAYFAAHQAEFVEPERRRLSHIVLADPVVGARVLAEAREATAERWGELVQRHSLDRPPPGAPAPPVELAGDLGIISARAEDGGPVVPEPVRRAGYALAKVGDVAPELVRDGLRFHVVKLTGRTDARERTFAEADRAVRLAMVHERLRAREAELEADLRRRVGVTIDEGALARFAAQPPVPSAAAAAASSAAP